MKTIVNIILLSISLSSCLGVSSSNSEALVDFNLNKSDFSKENQKQFSDYWYNGTAELTAYELSQARYGEIHEGKAVLIFVTEQFLPKKQVKADQSSPENITVLKLNSTKKYLTGIYPYSVMGSVFTPIDKNDHAIKATFSSQEWCGQTYIQLNNRKKFEVNSHSYFEGNGDDKFKIKKSYLENDIWTNIRMDPKSLPLGSLKMIPSLEFFGMNHQQVKVFQVNATLVEKDSLNYYQLSYPELNRVLIIKFEKIFPFAIEGWEETYKKQTTTATRIKSIRSDYWNKNSVKDTVLRKELGL
ncbi:septum formation inhibitor Maf [Putridiphycobacter roseus]|uniref:Septum formation inhibitor Maf n=1 Tax=Putridiphycobacter roseus TaxID=2219161 RepID=A0A2W1MZ41_9FLAO|nr:septum formation inhibitor Maf [Putridiphycobacter roseus]PZE16510.1 septum formation inhibitor Maf [Putridiphycobacter roseus]